MDHTTRTMMPAAAVSPLLQGYEMPDGSTVFGQDAAERAMIAWQKETAILLREILIRLDTRL